MAGLLAVAFKSLLAAAEGGRSRLLVALAPHETWGLAVLPSIGMVVGSLVGWMTVRFAPDAAGSGIPHLKGVLLHLRKFDWRRVLPVKFIGGVLGIGVGLSLGREGPTVQMGAACADALARMLKVPRGDVPQLMSAGAGAGLAAAFNAPLAGLVFIIEELHRELSARTAIGGLVACVTATVVAHALSADIPTFEVHRTLAIPLWVLPWACLVGLASAVGGVLFNKGLLLGERWAPRLERIPRWLQPGLAGALVGLAAWWIPLVAGGGHALADGLLAGTLRLSAGALLALLALKYVLTLVSYSSGAPGGIFAPMLVLGILIGALCTRLMVLAAPALQGHATSLAVLAMAGFFIASVRAPLTGIVLISELTGGYSLLLPICAVAAVAYLTSDVLRDRPIYESLLEADLRRRGHREAAEGPVAIYVGIQNGSGLADKSLRELALPFGCLVVAVERSGKSLHPSPGLLLRAGDHITVSCPGDQPEAPARIAALCTGL